MLSPSYIRAAAAAVHEDYIVSSCLLHRLHLVSEALTLPTTSNVGRQLFWETLHAIEFLSLSLYLSIYLSICRQHKQTTRTCTWYFGRKLFQYGVDRKMRLDSILIDYIELNNECLMHRKEVELIGPEV